MVYSLYLIIIYIYMFSFLVIFTLKSWLWIYIHYFEYFWHLTNKNYFWYISDGPINLTPICYIYIQKYCIVVNFIETSLNAITNLKQNVNLILISIFSRLHWLYTVYCKSKFFLFKYVHVLALVKINLNKVRDTFIYITYPFLKSQFSLVLILFIIHRNKNHFHHKFEKQEFESRVEYFVENDILKKCYVDHRDSNSNIFMTVPSPLYHVLVVWGRRS